MYSSPASKSIRSQVSPRTSPLRRLRTRIRTKAAYSVSPAQLDELADLRRQRCQYSATQLELSRPRGFPQLASSKRLALSENYTIVRIHAIALQLGSARLTVSDLCPGGKFAGR
jgi:hypothetical protein